MLQLRQKEQFAHVAVFPRNVWGKVNIDYLQIKMYFIRTREANAACSSLLIRHVGFFGILTKKQANIALLLRPYVFQIFVVDMQNI